MIPSSFEKTTTLSESEPNQMARINEDNSSDSKVEQIKKNKDLLDFGNNSVSKSVNSKTWSKCLSAKIPYTGIKITVCGEVEVGYVYIKFCGKLGGVGRKCKTFAVWDSKNDCDKLVSVGSSTFGVPGVDVFIKVCPYNLKISKKSISTNVEFKLCGDIPWFDPKCTTFWSQRISQSF